MKYRDPKNSGLVSILHPWESGYDNSPLWDEPLNEIKIEKNNTLGGHTRTVSIFEQKKKILVDRGWIKRERSRESIPNINLQEETVVVSGILESPELGLVLSEDLVTKTWPKISSSRCVRAWTNPPPCCRRRHPWPSLSTRCSMEARPSRPCRLKAPGY